MHAHHVAWLEAHPERSRDWLRRMMDQGFQVHHVDLDHGNNHPANLVLIEGVDHMRLHGLFRLWRPDAREVVREAGRARWAKKSPEERSAHARVMGNTRWKKVRKAKRAAAAHRAANAERAEL